MVRKLVVLIVLSILIMCQGLLAGDYTVALSTHNPTSGVADFANGGYPNIAGGAKIDKIILTNGSVNTVSQVIVLYDTCTSSMTATVSQTYDLPASTGAVTIDYPAHNPLVLTNLGIKKSSASSAVNVNIQYR